MISRRTAAAARLAPPRASGAAVAAINAAIEALAKAFADRGIQDGVQVNSVSPGAVMTGRRLAMLEKLAARWLTGTVLRMDGGEVKSLQIVVTS